MSAVKLVFSATDLESMLSEARATAKTTGRIWCNDIHNCCKTLCFCDQLESEWERLSKHPLPYILQLQRKRKACKSAPLTQESGVYSDCVSIVFFRIGISWFDFAIRALKAKLQT